MTSVEQFEPETLAPVVDVPRVRASSAEFAAFTRKAKVI